MSLKHCMDVKTLSAIISHISAKTRLNIYTHITSEMEENAAVSIDRGIAKAEVEESEMQKPAEPQKFIPYTTPRRRPGTGYIKQLAAYLRENPGVSNKSYIARQLGMDVTTVRKYYV